MSDARSGFAVPCAPAGEARGVATSQRRSGAARFATLLVALLCTAAGPRPKPAEKPGPKPEPKPARVESVFEAQTGLAPGWTDLGWSPRDIAPGAPASIDFSSRGGWIVGTREPAVNFTTLTFRVRAPVSFGEFLDVRVDSSIAPRFPRVRVRFPKPGPADGWVDVRIPLSELDPKNEPFDRIVFQAFGDVGHERVLLDRIALSGQTDPPLPPPAKTVHLSIDCGARPHAISPAIYGIAHGDPGWAETGATIRRWGGNPNTRYNWELGNAWNTASDWFFRNYGGGGIAWQMFLDDNAAHGVGAAITVPMIGWVAKDTTSYSFPVSVFGSQRAVDPQNADSGNGVATNGTLLDPLPPGRTSIPAPPSFIARWVTAIREYQRTHGAKVEQYILDNEPTLWSVTHRDVHPQPVGYDELLDKTVRYASAIRQVDPETPIAGFVAWGWTALFYSARDAEPSYQLQLDRTGHGGEPFLPWWLRRVREQEKRTGSRLVDIVDVHFYPQMNLGLGTSGATDRVMAERRIRSTRSLWDPGYVDESWINEPMRLIPKLRDWIAENAPGMGIQIGEYNFGAEGHMSGGLAVAEALGRFGQEGLTSAFYWTAPAKNTPAFWAFRAYRNFDGKGGHFLDLSAPTRSEERLTSIFASRDESGKHLVAVLLQLDPSAPVNATIDLGSCGTVKARRVYAYTGGASGFAPVAADGAPARILHERLAPYSMTVLDLKVEPPERSRR